MYCFLNLKSCSILQALRCVVMFLLLAPFDNEQSDLMHRFKTIRELEKLSIYRWVKIAEKCKCTLYITRSYKKYERYGWKYVHTYSVSLEMILVIYTRITRHVWFFSFRMLLQVYFVAKSLVVLEFLRCYYFFECSFCFTLKHGIRAICYHWIALISFSKFLNFVPFEAIGYLLYEYKVKENSRKFP